MQPKGVTLLGNFYLIDLFVKDVCQTEAKTCMKLNPELEVGQSLMNQTFAVYVANATPGLHRILKKLMSKAG
jgi:hypothetical protein